MYDDPPDPEPNPCPYCDDELGYGNDCDHCKLAATLAEVESAASTLRYKLHCRTRQLAYLPPGPEAAARRAEGIALLLDLGGLKLPDHYLKQAAAAMTGEYGEYPPFGKGGGEVSDEHIIDRFMEFAHGQHLVASPGVFSAEVLDAKPVTAADQLWWGEDESNVPRIFSTAEKRKARIGGSTQWGLTLRQTIEQALDSQQGHTVFWMEFFREYLRRPANLVPKDDPRTVRGGGQPKVSFVVGDTAYTAYPGKHKSEHWNSQGLGFGGAEFVVKLDDGREFFTDNNWHRGTVPPKLRKLMPPNAVFLKGDAAKKVPAEAAA